MEFILNVEDNLLKQNCTSLLWSTVLSLWCKAQWDRSIEDGISEY